MKGRLIIIAPFPKNVDQRNNIFFRFVVQNRRKTYPVTIDPTVYPKKPAVHTRLIVSAKETRLRCFQYPRMRNANKSKSMVGTF